MTHCCLISLCLLVHAACNREGAALFRMLKSLEGSDAQLTAAGPSG